MNFLRCRVSFLFLLVLVFAPSSRDATAQARVQQQQQGVAAELVDYGDFYWHPDGHRIRFLRKKNVYAVRYKKSASRNQATREFQQLRTHLGEQLELLENHGLGNTRVVRLKKSVAGKKNAISPQRVQSSDPSIERLVPVLSNSKGQGDILLSDKLLIKLSADQSNVEQALASLLSTYALSVDRRLKTSGSVFSLLTNRTLTVEQQFQLVRNLAQDSRIEWAQPQFKSKAFKTAFTPNDPLFDEQWHLRNTGKSGSRCDTDCDANNAWDIGDANGAGHLTGANTVIAVIDDGVQLDHEDLAIWSNPNEVVNGMDDDGNGCIDDINGCDFVDDSLSALLNPLADLALCKTLLVSQTDPMDGNGIKCRCQDNDGTAGPDGDPSPQADSDCLTFDDEVIAEQDDHGTAVAGIAAAIGNNNTGVAGTAYSATILPIRLISDFDGIPSEDFCSRAVEAMTYAGLYADVINNSWGMVQGTCPALDTVINKIVDGTLEDVGGNVPRRDGKGSPVVFAAGNSASGWVKVTVPVSEGEHAYEWRFLRSAFPEFFDDFSEDDAVWLDDIRFPDGSIEAFETDLGAFENQCDLNQCNGDCDNEILSTCPVWTINSNPAFSRSGNSAGVDQQNAFCSYSYLHQIKDGPAGEISFWVWVSTDQQIESDKFEFLVDGVEVLSFGDLARVVNNSVGYPASLVKTIAVGASDSGDLSGTSTASLAAEERIFYSQYGPELDVLAPSSDQHLGIVTTDRYGSNASGYNIDRDIDNDTIADPNYTDDFGGTSAAAPVVAGIAAAIIAADSSLNMNPADDITAAGVETVLRATADKIGRRGLVAYDQDGNQRSDFYGYGRVNMFAALKSVLGASDVDSTSCSAQAFGYSSAVDLILGGFSPQPTEFCAAQGPLLPGDELCIPVKANNGKLALICL